MDTKIVTEEEQKDILSLAKKAKYNCDLLIRQCDSWLPEKADMKRRQVNLFMDKITSKLLKINNL